MVLEGSVLLEYDHMFILHKTLTRAPSTFPLLLLLDPNCSFCFIYVWTLPVYIEMPSSNHPAVYFCKLHTPLQISLTSSDYHTHCGLLVWKCASRFQKFQPLPSHHMTTSATDMLMHISNIEWGTIQRKLLTERKLLLFHIVPLTVELQ